MTYSACYSNGSWFGKWVIIGLFLLLIGIGLFAFQMPNNRYYSLYGELVMVSESYTLSEHAAERHSEKAEKVIQCLNQKGSVLDLFNPITQRTAHVCQIEENKFGVLITEGEQKCVTCFIKDKMKELGKVIQYLANVGYH